VAAVDAVVVADGVVVVVATGFVGGCGVVCDPPHAAASIMRMEACNVSVRLVIMRRQ
jgi:hypothetical protein